MTIIKRAVGALRASGNTASADELSKHAALLVASFHQMGTLLRRKELLTRLLITTIQHRCPHHEWTFAWHPRIKSKVGNDPEEMACYVCGLTVKHAEVAKYAKRMADGGSYILARADGRVTLPPYLRKAVSLQFITKEQVKHAHQETLRDHSNGTGEGTAAGGAGQPGDTESEGRTMGQHDHTRV